MNTDALMSIISSIIVLAIIGTIFYIRLKNSPKEEDKESARKFLEGLKDGLNNLIVGIIRDFKYDDYDNFVDIKNDVLIRINDMCETYIDQKISESNDVLSILALKALKSGMISDFIDEVISNFNVEGTIEVHATRILQANLDESEKEDKELQEEFKSETDYYLEKECTVDQLEKVSEEELKEEEEKHISEIKPPRDDEEEYNPEDPSMEILKEDETGDEDNNIYYDSNGRARSKSTGKFVKVGKNEL